jgi:hypothetical protein
MLVPLLNESPHENRIDEKKLLELCAINGEILHLANEYSPLRTALVLLSENAMNRSSTISKWVIGIDNITIKSLGKIFPTFAGGDIFIIAEVYK